MGTQLALLKESPIFAAFRICVNDQRVELLLFLSLHKLCGLAIGFLNAFETIKSMNVNLESSIQADHKTI